MIIKDRTTVVKHGEGSWVDRTTPKYRGLREKILIGSDHGSLHQEVASVELQAGGVIPGHYHPFEESFYLTEGEVIFSVADKSYRLHAGHYGFAPVATPHAWRNVSDAPARWLRIRAPQPKRIGSSYAIYDFPDLQAPDSADLPKIGSPLTRYVGHFDGEMPPYGPIATRGITCYSVKHISTRLLVEDTLGATHHVVFLVELPPATEPGRSIDPMQADPVAKTHFHQFEEVYHFISGQGLAYLAGERHVVNPGDTILAGVGGSHAVINIGSEPLRWLETQAPRPPERDALFWERDWLASDALDA
jgi:quercetin dioxygenase-like cupin family protein